MIYLKDSKIQVLTTQEIARVFRDLLQLEDDIEQEKEHFYAMHLDSKSRVKMVEVITVGTLNRSLVHPRETFRRAVIEASAYIIVAHNHPSGDPEPSEEDTRTTRVLLEAGQIIGIRVDDHIIFTHDKFYSFKDCRTQDIQEPRLIKKK